MAVRCSGGDALANTSGRCTTGLDRLHRELATGDVVVREDDQGTYLQATTFESFTDGDQVVPAAEALIVRLNGIFSLSSGYQSLSFSAGLHGMPRRGSTCPTLPVWSSRVDRRWRRDWS
jgi:hypothetical protein